METRTSWSPPADWPCITTIDSHTAGEPFRLITSGVPSPEGTTILERRHWAKENLDHIRGWLMWEPRGHADMYGGLLVPPERPDSDFGILFMHNEGFSTMCGHGIIAIATIVLETGMFPAEPGSVDLRIDTPAGQVAARAQFDGQSVQSVSFVNVPSFVQALDQEVQVPGLGTVEYDLAFGGAFYAFVQVEDLGLDLQPGNAGPLIEAGKAIKLAVQEHRPPRHPGEPDLSFLYGTILVGPPSEAAIHSRNVCIFANGELDRCPTGTGVSARLAIHHMRGDLNVGEWITIESILGSRFRGRVAGLAADGSAGSILPEVEGSAHLTGRHEFTVDPSDPLAEGFLIR